MRYVPCWKQIGISKDRYIELLHFCRQYPEWKIEANSLLGIRGMKMDGQPKGTSKTDPVATAAERRESLTRKIDLVDECAKKIKDGEWYEKDQRRGMVRGDHPERLHGQSIRAAGRDDHADIVSTGVLCSASGILRSAGQKDGRGKIELQGE